MPIFEDKVADEVIIGDILERDGKRYVKMFDNFFAEYITTVGQIEDVVNEIKLNRPTVH